MERGGIPGHRREQVKRREARRCFNCGNNAVRGQWHHRRSRSVHDAHTHCSCNGVWLCRTCHEWVHLHPFEARARGLIVLRSVREPFGVIATSFMGDLILDCNGSFEIPREEEDA